MSSSDSPVRPSLPSAVPSYSSLPLADEQRLEYTPRSWEIGLGDHTSTYSRYWRSAIVALSAQAPGAVLPVYGRGDTIEGELCLTERAGVQRIEVQLFGLMTAALMNNGKTETVVAQRQRVVWEARAGNTEVSKCPSTVAFALQFPQTYVDKRDDHRRSLPPTFEAIFTRLPMLTATCAYKLRISVTRLKRRSLIGSGERSKMYELPLLYRPRNRPARPCMRSASLSSSLKSQPEEWTQIVKTMNAKDDKGLPSLYCNVFLPSVQVYYVRDSIPIHVQVAGPVSSFREFMPSLYPTDDNQVDDAVNADKADRRRRLSSIFRGASQGVENSNTDSPLNWRSKLFSSADTFPQAEVGASPLLVRQHAQQQAFAGQPGSAGRSPSIRVSIMRQVYAEVNGVKTWRMLTLGQGTVTQLSPPPYDVPCIPNDVVAIDWEGDVRCQDLTSTVGFNNGHVTVVDFLALSIIPASGALQTVRFAHPIRLVTDPWSDSAVHPLDR
ncbi:hypothetical protein BD626DRAFT_421416 [Schizophyllum amplum]|uniref:Arrestin-like N-terminal domain-containing protein n=1 Tax=Schizophyllum amplum TaxID=97359 RepID=A0A550CWY3_9AGAR|nr:hypothetical protein BD626DRAFT_421416 [Auriculariopsis ampla]